MFENLPEVALAVVAVLSSLVVLAHVVVKLTPSKRDDEAVDRFEKKLKPVLDQLEKLKSEKSKE